MILEAAKSIAAANSALVKAASAAQRELIDQGKVRWWKDIHLFTVSRGNIIQSMKTDIHTKYLSDFHFLFLVGNSRFELRTEGSQN
jgi:hypothetical protein